MPEEVLFKSEDVRTRQDVASLLRSVADNLEDGASIDLSQGDQSISMDPPARPTFEVKAEREGPEGGPYELSVEFELEWDEDQSGADESGSLSIE